MFTRNEIEPPSQGKGRHVIMPHIDTQVYTQ